MSNPFTFSSLEEFATTPNHGTFTPNPFSSFTYLTNEPSLFSRRRHGYVQPRLSQHSYEPDSIQSNLNSYQIPYIYGTPPILPNTVGFYTPGEMELTRRYMRGDNNAEKYRDTIHDTNELEFASVNKDNLIIGKTYYLGFQGLQEHASLQSFLQLLTARILSQPTDPNYSRQHLVIDNITLLAAPGFNLRIDGLKRFPSGEDMSESLRSIRRNETYYINTHGWVFGSLDKFREDIVRKGMIPLIGERKREGKEKGNRPIPRVLQQEIVSYLGGRRRRKKSTTKSRKSNKPKKNNKKKITRKRLHK